MSLASAACLPRRPVFEGLEARLMLDGRSPESLAPSPLQDPAAGLPQIVVAAPASGAMALDAGAGTVWGPLIPFSPWNQNGPINGGAVTWNQYCPIDPTTQARSLVGCGPTAVAQVLYYWHFPQSMSFSTSLDSYTSHGSIHIDADASTYDFASFAELNAGLSSIQYDGSAEEEAALSFAVGLKLHASYSSTVTVATVTNSVFGELGFESADWGWDWASTKPYVIENIKAGQPAIVSLKGPGAGHYAVLDGYDSVADTFHVDLGWGPAYANANGHDDWYSLPGFSAGGYTFTTIDGIIYDIEPYLQGPASLTASQGTYDTRIHLEWTRDPPAVGYDVWRGTTDNPSTATRIASNIIAGQTSYDDAAVAGHRAYYYWVRSYRLNGVSGFGVSAQGYVHGSAPTIAAISPASGPAVGGTQVTITGTCLAGATAVTFGSVRATIVSNTASQIEVLSPAGIAGTVDVTVVTPNGTSAATAPDRFSYQGPVVTNVSSPAASGVYKAGAVIPITVAFNQAVSVTGSPTLALNDGGTAVYAGGSGGKVLTFGYTVTGGHGTADLDYASTTALACGSGTIRDSAGSPANLTLAAPGAAGSLGYNKDLVIDTPVLSGLEAAALAYQLGSGAVTVTSTLAVGFAATGNLVAAVVEIGNYHEGQDVLSFADTASITGHWDATYGLLTLSGSDTKANYQAALRTVTYQNTGGSLDVSNRTISLFLYDGTANSNTAYRDIMFLYMNLSGDFATPSSTPLPTSAVAGRPLAGNVAVTVTNLGNAALPAGQTVSILFVARDTTDPDNPDIPLATLANRSVSRLAAGGARTFTACVSRLQGLPAGTYQIVAEIVPSPALVELSTDDNWVTSPARTVTVAPAIVNLAAAFGVRHAMLPSSVVAGKAFHGILPVTITNEGNVPLPPGQQVDIQVMVQDLANPGAPNIVLGVTLGRSVRDLPAGGSRTFSILVNRPEGLPAGNYQVLACISPVQDLEESDTLDNRVDTPAKTITSVPAMANLAGTLGPLWLRTSAPANEPLKGYASVVVTNAGNDALPSGQQITIRFVARDSFGTDTVLAILADRSASALAPHASRIFLAPISLSAGLPAGAYRILAEIIPVQPLAESDTADNWATVTAQGLSKTLTAS